LKKRFSVEGSWKLEIDMLATGAIVQIGADEVAWQSGDLTRKKRKARKKGKCRRKKKGDNFSVAEPRKLQERLIAGDVPATCFWKKVRAKGG